MYSDANANPLSIGFLKWQKDVKSPTLRFLLELTLNTGLAIYVQRIGDRSNNFRMIHAGRMKFFETFFAFNHPIYREVEYSELCNQYCGLFLCQLYERIM